MGAKLKDIFKEGTGYKVFFISLVIGGLSYGLYKGMIDNYLAEIVTMGELDRGIAEFFREIPGLLLVFILAILYNYSAETIYKVGAVIMVIGLGMLSLVSPTKLLVTIAIFVHSLGEHIQLGMKNTLSLEYSKEGKGGEALGHQNAVYQIGTLAGYAVIIAVFAVFAESAGKLFKPFFAAAAVCAAIGMFFAFRLSGKSETDKSKNRFYFRKKFGKFYMLEIFYGARKQVFFTFGPYVLILFYGAGG